MVLDKSKSIAALPTFASLAVEQLSRDDPHLYELLEREYQRQEHVLAMIASSSIAAPSVLACEGLTASNVTTEGYPGMRFHAGCAVIDAIEQLAIERARIAFKACYANVQPHSGTSANATVLLSLLKPGDTILGLSLDAGGHLTHGAQASFSGQYFNAIGYGLDADGLLDYEQVYRLARAHRPRLIICGASAYPRMIDFKRFRAIADAVGAYLLADISHIAGLVVAGIHPTPIDEAHFTTTSTYKQLYGPRGGLILLGKDFASTAPDGKKTLAELMQRAVFPFFQGTPDLGAIAAKARALAYVATPAFQALAQYIVADAACLAEALLKHGYRVLTGGTDTHLVLMDVLARGLTGVIAERALEECNIVVNKNRIPGDRKAALVTSGVRLGTNILALRGMGKSEMEQCANLIHLVLADIKALGDTQYSLTATTRANVLAEVQALTERFPIPSYPTSIVRA